MNNFEISKFFDNIFLILYVFISKVWFTLSFIQDEVGAPQRLCIR